MLLGAIPTDPLNRVAEEKIFNFLRNFVSHSPENTGENEIWIWRGRLILGASTPLSDL